MLCWAGATMLSLLQGEGFPLCLQQRKSWCLWFQVLQSRGSDSLCMCNSSMVGFPFSGQEQCLELLWIKAVNSDASIVNKNLRLGTETLA